MKRTFGLLLLLAAALSLAQAQTYTYPTLQGNNSWLGTQAWHNAISSLYVGSDGTNPVLVDASGSSISTSNALLIKLPAIGSHHAIGVLSGTDAVNWFDLNETCNGTTYGGIELGAGGTSARDAFLCRGGAGLLTTPGKLQVGATACPSGAPAGSVCVGAAVIAPVHVAALPAAANNTGMLQLVSDGVSTADCTTGGGTSQALCISNGTSWGAALGIAYYQTVQAASTAMTQRPILDFSAAFSVTDDATNTRSIVDLANSGVAAGTYGSVNVSAKGIITGGSTNTVAIIVGSQDAAWSGTGCSSGASQTLTFTFPHGIVACGVSTSVASAGSVDFWYQIVGSPAGSNSVTVQRQCSHNDAGVEGTFNIATTPVVTCVGN